MIDGYIKAYNDKSIEEIKRIWPNMDTQLASTLREFFRSAKNLRSSYTLLDEPQINGTEATVKIAQVTTLEGQQESMSEHRVIRLSRAPSTLAWEIISVSSE